MGPVLLGAAKPVHILTASTTVRRIVNMAALAVADANISRQTDEASRTRCFFGEKLLEAMTALGGGSNRSTGAVMVPSRPSQA